MILRQNRRLLAIALAFLLAFSFATPFARADEMAAAIAPERVVPGVLTENGTGGFYLEFSKNGALVTGVSFAVFEKLPSTDAAPGAYRQIYSQSAAWTEGRAAFEFDGEFFFLGDQIACPSGVDGAVLSFPLMAAEGDEIAEVAVSDDGEVNERPDGGEWINATRLFAADLSGEAAWYMGAENRPWHIEGESLALARRRLNTLDELYTRTLYYSFIVEDAQGEQLLPPRAFDYRGMYLADVESRGGGVIDGVLCADHVIPDMLRAEYWIDKVEAPDAVLMSPDEIQALNRETLVGLESMHDLDAYPEMLSGEALEALIREYTLPDTAQYSEGDLLSPGYWAVLDAQRNTASIEAQMPVRYGIITRRTDGRGFPTDDFVADTPEDMFFDNLQAAEMYPMEAVLVLHESVDGMWLFVLNEAFGGWIHKEDVALCADQSEWTAARTAQDFLVVTADRFRLDVDPYGEALSGMELDMGVVLPLADPEEWPDTISGRDAYGNYIVKLPRRADDGCLAWAYVPIPFSEDVSRGHLPYTAANALTQAFKMLGGRYGWGGSLGANDCSGYVRQVFAVFGFRLPRNSGQQALVSAKRVPLTGLSVAERAQALTALKPGALLQFPGHIMFYLGEDSGFYYVISSAGSFIPLSAENEAVSPASTILVNDLTVTRKNHLSWFESLAVAISLES